MESKYYKSLSGDIKERYEEKIRKCGVDPYVIKKKELSENPKDFPEITILDIGEYLVHSVSFFTKKKFSAYKSTEAYKHFESGFVLNIGSKRNKEYAILRGRVKHGQKMNESPLQVWVLANMNGKIDCSHCTCLAGLSETCSHVGALCYAVSSFWNSNETKSVTDFLCKWNVPSFKEESMTFVTNIQWRSHSTERPTLESGFVTYCNSLTPFSDETIEEFIKGCHSDGNWTAVGTILFPQEKRKTSIKDEVFLASLYSHSNKERTRRELIEMGKSISINLSSDDVNKISCLTIARLKSKCRFALKRGRVIASSFKECCNANIDNPSIRLINRLMNPMNFDFNPRHITQKKKKALEHHFKRKALHHQELEQYECGLIINPNFPYFAASPDFLITCNCHGEGCIIIKFIKIMDSADSFEVLTQGPNHILNRNQNEYTLNKTHDFYYQLQLQINVVELKYCDLIIWSPKPNLRHLILRVHADVDFWRANMEKARKFHEQVMMPEILGKWFTSKGEVNVLESEVDQDEDDILVAEVELTGEPGYFAGQDDDVLANEILPSSPYESENYEDISANELKPNIYDSKTHDSVVEISHIDIRNLKNEPAEDILKTFFEHEDYLKRLYDEHIKQQKIHYKPKDMPEMIAYDIVNIQQFQAMVDFAETHLVQNLEKEHESSDILFDAIIPEWAVAVFCKKFNFTRSDAFKILRLQALKEISDSEF